MAGAALLGHRRSRDRRLAVARQQRECGAQELLSRLKIRRGAGDRSADGEPRLGLRVLGGLLLGQLGDQVSRGGDDRAEGGS